MWNDAGLSGTFAVAPAIASFERDGFVVLPPLIDAAGCDAALTHTREIAGVGSRNLLDRPPLRDLATHLRSLPALAPLLPPDALCVQCTLFAKGSGTSWSVGAHQDLGIPVAKRIDVPGFTGWRQKEGAWYVQPPTDVLATLVAVRLQLDADAARSGPLEVVPGSHDARLSAADASTFDAAKRVACVPARGGAVVMRPLIVHASGTGDPDLPRRVLHFLFAPPGLPGGLMWAGTTTTPTPAILRP